MSLRHSKAPAPSTKDISTMPLVIHDSHKSWVSSVQWSPTDPFVLASTSHDGTLKVSTSIHHVILCHYHPQSYSPSGVGHSFFASTPYCKGRESKWRKGTLLDIWRWGHLQWRERLCGKTICLHNLGLMGVSIYMMRVLPWVK